MRATGTRAHAGFNALLAHILQLRMPEDAETDGWRWGHLHIDMS